MDGINQIIEKVDVLISSEDGINSIKLPAIREVMEPVASSRENQLGYAKHSDHTKSSTRGCVMGCLGG